MASRSSATRAYAPGRYAPPLLLREARQRPAFHCARDVARHILEQRYGVPAGPPPAAAGLLSFQADAVQRARAILARRRGVLIADSVGLGKTHIAAALLEPFVQARGRAAIVGPAALRRHWLKGISWSRAPDWISYARLSRGTHARERYDIIVFDEAHALRNPATRRYHAASALCRDARVVLLSATPVNNSIWDLYHLLRLFCRERDLLDTGVVSLHRAFEQAATSSLLGTAPAIQPVLRALMIRRTRPLIRSTAREEAEQVRLVFPAHRPPVAIRYALAATASADALDVIGRGLLGLDFPAHARPARASRARRDTPLGLLRLGLLKRLESSVHAFGRSISAYDAMLARCLDGLAHGLLVQARDDPDRDADGAQLRLDALLFEPLPEHFRAYEYRQRLEAERARLRSMLAALAPALEADGKLDVLRALLGGELLGHRVLVFTQYRDTARYLHARLCRSMRAGLIDGSTARLGEDRVDRLTVLRSFAPSSNGATPPPAHRAVDVLVATDVLAEGFNLQDADVVISYDLPWNPVRLMQRIGRIDRLGSTHSSIGSYHFVPGELERYLGLLDRIARKASAIDASVGSDMPALHAELVRALDRQDAGAIGRIEEKDAEWFELDERLQHLLATLPRPSGWRIADGALPAALIPPTIGAGSAAPDHPSGLVAARVAERFEWVAVVDGRPIEDERLCARVLEAALASGCDECHGSECDSLPAPSLAPLLDAVRPVLARRAAVASTAALLPAGGASARLGRRLLALAALLPGGPDAGTCRRLELCLERLAGLGPDDILGLEASAIGARAPRALSLLLDAVERSAPMGGHRPAAAPGQPNAVTVQVVGALLER